MKRWALVFLMGCTATQGPEAEDSVEGKGKQDPIPAVTKAKAEAEAAKEAEKIPDPPPELLDKPVERRLYPHSFTASSYLENDWNKFQENYLPEYLGDDDPQTSWTEGKPDVGLGESVRIEHTPLHAATKLRLQVRNGYQKSESLFKKNARAKGLSLKLLPSGTVTNHLLEDRDGWQTIEVEQPEGKLHGYEMAFVSVYPGTKYQDLVISDIQTFVTSRHPDNPSFEKTKRDRLMSWIRERKEAAETFKEAAKGSIPVASSYKTMKTPGAPKRGDYTDQPELPFKLAAETWGDEASVLSRYDEAATSRFEGWTPVRVSTIDKRKIPQADAFMFPGPWYGESLFYEGDAPAIVMPIPREMGFLSANSLKRTYDGTVKVTPKQAMSGDAPGCNREDESKTFFFTQEDKSAALETLLIVTCGTFEDREGYSQSQYWQLVHYNPEGQLIQLFDGWAALNFTWETRDGAPFLAKVDRVTTAGSEDTTFVAR